MRTSRPRCWWPTGRSSSRGSRRAPDSWYTAKHQRERLAESLARRADGLEYPGVIMVDDRMAGRVNLNNIVQGAFRSADLGYWVGQSDTGHGVATAAVGAILTIAFDELGLHRVQAGTLLHNGASQRVLQRNGFTRIGVAPDYLKIAGRWQDHVLFQRLAGPHRVVQVSLTGCGPRRHWSARPAPPPASPASPGSRARDRPAGRPRRGRRPARCRSDGCRRRPD